MRKSSNIRTLLMIMICLVPLIIAPWTYDYFYYPKILSVYIITLVMIGIHINAKDRLKLHIHNSTKVLMGYWLLLIVSTFFSIDPINSIWGGLGREEGLITIFAYGLLFMIAKNYFTWDKKYLKWLIGSAVIVSLYGILQYFGLDPIPRDDIRYNWGGRAFSTIGNPNFLGSYLILMLPLPMISFIESKKILPLIGSSIIYTCLLLTFTRSAIIGFFIILVLIAVYIYKNKFLWKKAVLLVSVFSLITIVINFQSNGKLFSRVLSIGSDAKILIEKEEAYEKAGANRVYIWMRTLDLVKERPVVGYGLENLQLPFVNKYSDEMTDLYGTVYLVDRAHNEYLHIAVSSGIPSLVLYLIFILLCLKKGLTLLRKDTRYLPYFTAVCAYLVQAFFNISVVSVVYIFWIFLGLITNEKIFQVSESRD